MLQQQIDIIQDLATSMKDVVDACEYYTDENICLNDRLAVYEEEFSEFQSLYEDEVIELHKTMEKLQAENFKLRKTIWQLKSVFKCDCEGVKKHTCMAWCEH